MRRESCDPGPAQRRRRRRPRPLFLLQQRRLVKGKDVRGGGSSSGRRVSRGLGGSLAQPGALAPPPRPSAGGERDRGGGPEEVAGGRGQGRGFHWGEGNRGFLETQVPRGPSPFTPRGVDRTPPVKHNGGVSQRAGRSGEPGGAPVFTPGGLLVLWDGTPRREADCSARRPHPFISDAHPALCAPYLPSHP